MNLNSLLIAAKSISSGTKLAPKAKLGVNAIPHTLVPVLKLFLSLLRAMRAKPPSPQAVDQLSKQKEIH